MPTLDPESATFSLNEVYELFLLALCVWREARGEPIEAKRGVAWTVKNRAANPSWWGTDIVSVILKPAQFTSFSPMDPNASKWPSPQDNSWTASLDVAVEVLSGQGSDPTSGATYYFDDSMLANPPSWAAQLEACAKLGRLNFYRRQTVL